MKRIAVYIESGKKRTFAGAIDWPGWCRSGQDEESAVQALFGCGGRYTAGLAAGGIAFDTPDDVTHFDVIERLEGGSTSDFGARR